jgi:glucokinase
MMRGTGSDPDFTVAIPESSEDGLMAQATLAIDIGGTKLASGIVASDGQVVRSSTVPTPTTSDPEELFEVLMNLVDGVVAGSEVPAVCGVGCGGPMEMGGTSVSPLNIPAWDGFALKGRLEERLGIPVRVENDAKALALGESWVGAASGVQSFLAMVVSTGVGGGLIVDGRLLDGESGNAGHIGHVVVEPTGRPCLCGAQGCLEAEASGTAIEAITGRPARDAGPEMVERCGILVGRAVASVVTLLDLRLCVVAGSVALGFGTPFFEAAQRSLTERTGLTYTDGARIVPAGLGASGPLIGAAAVGLGLGESGRDERMP